MSTAAPLDAPVNDSVATQHTTHDDRGERGHLTDLNEGQPGFPIYHRPRANPAPLGLFAFASTTMLLSLINVHARHVTAPDIAVGMAFAFGGLGQFFAGIAEFCVGNTFGMTAFCGYGAFWIAFGLLAWPASGILALDTTEGFAGNYLDSALGLFMITWFIFTFLLLLATFRSSAGLVALFFFLSMTFLLLAIGYFRASVNVLKAGGWFGIIASLIAYYVGAHSLLTAEAAPFALPNASLARKRL